MPEILFSKEKPTEQEAIAIAQKLVDDRNALIVALTPPEPEPDPEQPEGEE